MKKILSMVTVLALLCVVLTISAMARQEVHTSVTDLGNGITVERTITVNELSRSSTKKASSVNTYKNNGEEIATVTLTTTFDYDGTRAWVISSSGSHSVESGWTYKNENITNSGGTSRLTAELKSTTGLGRVPVDIDLVCTKNGEIS